MSAGVRAATPDDLADVLRLAAAASGLPHWSDEVYQRALEADGEVPLQRRTFVAGVDGVVCGFAVLSILQSVAPAECELEGIAVAPAHQGRGLGRALLVAVMAAARDYGAVQMRLEVRAGNSRAITLYRKQGFATTGTRPLYYDNPVEDATLMEARLVPGAQAW